MTNILAKFIREGQQVRLWAWPWDGSPADGELRSGTVAEVVHRVQVTVPRGVADTGDPDDYDTYDGVQLTFDDGTKWVAVYPARAIFEGGPPPSDEEITETMAADQEMHDDGERIDAEGVLGLIGVHSGPDEADRPVVIVHLPVMDEDSEVDVVEPEQAEAFAMRLLKVAAEVRVLRQMIADHDEHCDHDHGDGA